MNLEAEQSHGDRTGMAHAAAADAERLETAICEALGDLLAGLPGEAERTLWAGLAAAKRAWYEASAPVPAASAPERLTPATTLPWRETGLGRIRGRNGLVARDMHPDDAAYVLAAVREYEQRRGEGG